MKNLTPQDMIFLRLKFGNLVDMVDQFTWTVHQYQLMLKLPIKMARLL